MNVLVSTNDEQLARRAAVALHPLCDLLAERTDQDYCKVSLAAGVVVCEFWAKDGAYGKVAVGVRALAMAIVVGHGTLRLYANQLCRWAQRKQAYERGSRPLLPAISLN